MDRLNNKNGTVLVLVLGVILVVVIFSAIIISLILSQSRLTKHQVSRTKAYYAAQAGSNYVIELLRQGKLQSNSTALTFGLCNDSSASLCSAITNASMKFIDPDLPYSVNVTFQLNSTTNLTDINATSDYSYTP